MNTRRYPRTMSEAFKGTDYACAIERPARGVRGIGLLGGAALLALLLAALAVGAMA